MSSAMTSFVPMPGMKQTRNNMGSLIFPCFVLFNAVMVILRTQALIFKIGNATCLTSNTSKSSDAPAGPLPRWLRFYPAAHTAHEIIKKSSPILIPFASSSPVAAPCGGLILDADTHSPRSYRVPHSRHSLALRHARLSSHPVAHAVHSLPSRALVLVVLPPLGPSHAHRPPARPTQDRCWWRWCSRVPLELDASGARVSPPAPTPTPGIYRHRLPLPYVANISVLDVSEVYCSCFILMLQK
jgi:hypothetical protein